MVTPGDYQVDKLAESLLMGPSCLPRSSLMDCRVPKLGKKRHSPTHVDCQTSRATYSRLDFIDCRIVARCVRAPGSPWQLSRSYPGQSPFPSHRSEPPSPMAMTRRHDARRESQADTAETAVIAGASMSAGSIKSWSRTTFLTSYRSLPLQTTHNILRHGP